MSNAAECKALLLAKRENERLKQERRDAKMAAELERLEQQKEEERLAKEAEERRVREDSGRAGTGGTEGSRGGPQSTATATADGRRAPVGYPRRSSMDDESIGGSKLGGVSFSRDRGDCPCRGDGCRKLRRGLERWRVLALPGQGDRV